jgi:L-malate glycosyltransferase
VSTQSERRVLSLIRLNPNKFGSYEEFEIGLTKRCHQENIATTKVFVDLPPARITQQMEQAGSSIETFPEFPTRIASFRRFRQLVRKYNPEVLHISFFPFLTELVWWGRLLGVPHILFTDHASGAPSSKNFVKEKMHRLAVKICARQVDGIISVSDFVRQRLIRLGIPPDKIQVIYNGVNTTRFSPADRPEQNSKEPVFTLVANLIPEKGCSDFISAAEHFQHRQWPGRFLIVGTGPQRENHENQVGQKNLADRVKFLGIRSDVEKILSEETDIFVCPSLWEEAFGLGNIEAMASGLPVVAYRSGAIPEVVVDGKTGILVDHRQPDLLAGAMHRLAENPSLCRAMGNEGLLRVREKFQISRQIEETFQVYWLFLMDW